ncbi:DNA recombination protein RmuC [Candidatus Comchoanobacter bicostacola]|uniref:DNA recombination protein RmuC n=1 Tax=Candidatus Comchoanobacter bicostacola TaxID=2919598 RepID=A0ABY5DMN6_9GAMM|nr:DNA recombination protein RmuC [Candidatus Comchoanobacter bicostacola]UTC24907.1 DNA recombination protein RmuC [Candidatus Comchoanobacter bicostacola]
MFLEILAITLLLCNLLGLLWIKQSQNQNLAQIKNIEAQIPKDTHTQIDHLSKTVSLQNTQLKTEVLQNLLQTLKHQHDTSATNIKNLTESVHNRLNEISNRVDTKLQKNFDKNTDVIQDVIKRLTLIDKAQENITALSEQVVDLQKILTDKSSRGAYGEVQLEQLVGNIIPPQHYKMQATLSNGKRVDCLLQLPKPSGNMAIDAKFPLENFQKLCASSNAQDQKSISTLFKNDIKKHIDDISNKYIIAGDTAAGAIMFIPAEAVFAHIHAHLPEIVQYAQKQHVWLCSPTTLMAVLNTALGVIKDHATKSQVGIIKKHLVALSEDFSRFDKRMHQLARHIDQAHNDVGLIQTSSKKISQRFKTIEGCELPLEEEYDTIT